MLGTVTAKDRIVRKDVLRDFLVSLSNSGVGREISKPKTESYFCLVYYVATVVHVMSNQASDLSARTHNCVNRVCLHDEA